MCTSNSADLSGDRAGMQLRCLGEYLVHMAAGTYMWCCFKPFVFAIGAGSSRAVIEAVIRHPQYRDTYLGGGPEAQGFLDVHGPYRLPTVTADAYVPTSVEMIRDDLCEWARPPNCDSDACDKSVQILRSRVFGQLSAGLSWFRLDLQREGNEHESGRCVGTVGFHEFLVIDRAAGKALLLTASDD